MDSIRDCNEAGCVLVLGDTMKLSLAVIIPALTLLFATPAFAQLTPEEEEEFERALLIMGDHPAEARRLIEPLAAKGDAEALNFLSVMLQNDGPGWQADPERSAELREQAIAAGSKAAALNLAIRIMMDSEADHDRGIELLKIADTEPKIQSVTAYPWGRAYLFGWGVPQDMAKGVTFLETYVREHNGPIDDATIDAHFLLGRAYRNGWDVAVDADKAYRHFLIAADNKDRRAQWNVGMMLLTGEGVATDEAKAYDYVRRSAEAEHIDGMVSHAVMLALGQGVAEDDEAARDWYYEAALRGSAHAMRGLGMMLVTGEGGDAMPELGVAMLQLAAEAGEQDAVKLLDMIPEDAVDPSGVADARASWLEDHAPPDPVE
jgi:TPR repeat protein